MLDKIKLLHQERQWADEARLTRQIWEEHNKPSVRKLAEIVGKSKSWVDKSLQLAVGLRVYPYLEREPTRHTAYLFILKRKRQRR